MTPGRPKKHREGQGCEYSLEEVFTCSSNLYLNLRVCLMLVYVNMRSRDQET